MVDDAAPVAPQARDACAPGARSDLAYLAASRREHRVDAIRRLRAAGVPIAAIAAAAGTSRSQIYRILREAEP